MLDKSEIERYSRQILVSGLKGQESLKKAKVLVVGAGGIGSSLLPYLAAAGVGYIRFLEDDVIETSNLSRQIIYNDSEVGLLKGAVAYNKITEMNPFIQVDWISEKFSQQNAALYIKDMDFLIDGSDDISSKFLVSDLAVKFGMKAIISGIGVSQGHILVMKPQNDSPCYRCIFEKPPETGVIPTCATEGVISPLPGVMGAMIAYLVTNFFLREEILARLYTIENMVWRTLKIQKNVECIVCS